LCSLDNAMSRIFLGTPTLFLRRSNPAASSSQGSQK
jgi:hypothetical protein